MEVAGAGPGVGEDVEFTTGAVTETSEGVGSKPGTAGELGTDVRGLSELPLAFTIAASPATTGDAELGIVWGVGDPTSGPVVDFREKKLNIPFFSVGVGVWSSSVTLGVQPII